MRKLLISIAVCFSIACSLNASGMGRLFYAISESVVNEFASDLSNNEQYDVFDSIQIFTSSERVSSCDLVYKGNVIVKKEKIYFDVCIDINTDRSFDVAVSERNAND